MCSGISPLNRKPGLIITKEVRDGWRGKIEDLLGVLVEQCKDIQVECEVVLCGMSFYVIDDGDVEYEDVESAKEISRDESHALALQGLMESQLSCIDHLFNGLTSGYYSFPIDKEVGNE